MQYILTAVLTLLIFILDFFTPLGVANGMLYVAPILMASRTANRLFFALVIAVSMILVIAGYYVSPAGVVVYWVAVANRVLAEAMIIVTACIAYRHMWVEGLLNEHKTLLERRVAERTADLQRANELLENENRERARTEELLRTAKFELEMQNDELRNAREDLEVSRAKYVDLYNLSPIGYFTIDPQGMILEANLAAATLFGVTRDMLLKQRIARFITADYQDAYYLSCKKLYETGRPQSCELVMLRGGASFWVRMEAVRVADSESGASVIHVAMLDITARRMAENKFIESERALARAQEIAHVGSWELDIPTGTVTWSDESFRLFGFEPGSIEPSKGTFMGAVHPDDKKVIGAYIHDLITGKLPRTEHEMRIIRPDGQERVFFSKVEAIIGNDGTTAKLFGTNLDITERKSGELRMRMLRDAMDQADETVIITDADGVIEYANATTATKTGYPFEFLVGKSPRIFKSGVHSRAYYERLWKTVKSGHIWKGRMVNRRADGTHYEEDVTISPVLGGGGAISHFIAIRRDLDEQKRMQERLIHAEKLSSIGTFVAGVAHELNNPLTAVIGFSNDLRQRADLPEDLRQTLGIIADQSKRAVGVVKNLLSYSRPHKAERCLLDINKLLENTIGIHRYRLMADNISIETAFHPGPLTIYADEGQIQQVVVNILLNAQAAIRIAGPDGAIRVATRRETEWLEEAAVITISNSGSSIPPDNIGRIFDPYFTTKKSGHGLGLYVAHSIVLDHHGDICAENLPEGGVAFHITLPCGADERVAARVPAAIHGTIPAGGKILVVDDEAPVRDWLAGMLLRHRVFAAAAGGFGEAVDHLRNGTFDVIVSDYKMPGKDGIDLYGWLEEQRPESAKHFIFLTGVMDERLRQFCESRGLATLTKPVDEEAIIGAISQIFPKEG